MRLLPRRLEHGEEASVVDHLGELRSRIFFCLIAIVATTTFTYIFNGHIIDWLERPLPGHTKVVTLNPTEAFLTTFWISLWAGLLLALPIVMWQIWGFFAPAFDRHTQRKLIGFTLFAAGLMAGGIAFGYFIVLDPAIHFLTTYNGDQFHYQARADSYFSFVTLVMVATAIVFELPVFILALARIGILPADKLRRNRRMGYVLVAALAVALPGVDPVTTTLEMVPLLILFEASIWLAVLFDRRWKRDAAARDAAWQSEYGDSLDFGDGFEADAI
jgi:sec-independent protein translocase protein TatC